MPRRSGGADRITCRIDAAARFAAVISGHSHRPSRSIRQGVLYLNPGSAGPRRFDLPVALATLTVCGSALRCRLIELRV
jgi:predicted phosphodiesterase